MIHTLLNIIWVHKSHDWTDTANWWPCARDRDRCPRCHLQGVFTRKSYYKIVNWWRMSNKYASKDFTWNFSGAQFSDLWKVDSNKGPQLQQMSNNSDSIGKLSLFYTRHLQRVMRMWNKQQRILTAGYFFFKLNFLGWYLWRMNCLLNFFHWICGREILSKVLVVLFSCLINVCKEPDLRSQTSQTIAR